MYPASGHCLPSLLLIVVVRSLAKHETGVNGSDVQFLITHFCKTLKNFLPRQEPKQVKKYKLCLYYLKKTAVSVRVRRTLRMRLLPTIMHTEVFGWGGPRNVYGVRFSRVGQKFSYWAIPEILGLFQRFALKIFKIWNFMEIISKYSDLSQKISFFARTVWNNKIIIFIAYNREFGSQAARSHNNFQWFFQNP